MDIEQFKRWCAANLNDGEYPIPRSGRMNELSEVVDVIAEHVMELLAAQREELAKQVREWKKYARRGMMNEIETGYEAGAYSAFSDVLELIEGLHTKK